MLAHLTRLYRRAWHGQPRDRKYVSDIRQPQFKLWNDHEHDEGEGEGEGEKSSKSNGTSN